MTQVHAVDTVGAGDAFIGSLAAYIAVNCSLQEAIQKAVQVATITVTQAGAQASYPRASELPVELVLPAVVA